MNAYIQVIKKHSEKKNIDYTAVVLNLYGKDFFLKGMSNECILLLLDLKPSEINNLPVGFESEKLEINLGK